MNPAREPIRKQRSMPSDQDLFQASKPGRIDGDGCVVLLVILACFSVFFVADAIDNLAQIVSTHNPQLSLQSWGSFIRLHISSISTLRGDS